MARDGRSKEEKQAAIKAHQAAKKASNNAARKLRDEHMVHHQLNELMEETGRDVPWWRR